MRLLVLGADMTALKVPRVSSPVSFECFSTFARFFSLCVVLFFAISGSALVGDSEEIATPLLKARFLADDCVSTYNRNTDYFAGKKLNIAADTEFQVSYHKSYKVVTNLRASQATYVLYLCGTPNPNIDATLKATLPDLENPIFLVFPPPTYGVSSQTHFPLLSAIDVLAGFVLYPTFAELPSCVFNAATQGIVQPTSVETTCQFPSYETCTQTLWEDSNAAVFFADSFSVVEPVDDHVTVIISQENAASVISESSWLLYLSVFFNREAEAQLEFFTLTSQLDCFLNLVINDESALVVARNVLGLTAFALDSTSTPSRRLTERQERDLEEYRRNLYFTVTDPVVRANLLQTATPFGSARKSRTLEGEVTNVLILTGFDNFGEPGYYVARCSAYYCVHAETSGGNVDIIDAADLEIDPASFNHISQTQLLSSLHSLGKTINVVLFLYYLHTDPNGISRDYPGPSDNGNDFLTELLTNINPSGVDAPKLFYINNTDHWFSFRAGAPHFVQHDFIKMLNPAVVPLSNSLDNSSFYFFEEFEYQSSGVNVTQEVQAVILDLNQPVCPNLAQDVCEGAILVTPNPTPFVRSTPAPSSGTVLSLSINLLFLCLVPLLAVLA